MAIATRSGFTACFFVLCAAHCSADDSGRDHGTSAGGGAKGGSSGSGGTGLDASAGTGALAGAGASGGQAGVSPADATSDSASDTSTSDAGDAADATSGPGSVGCENDGGLSDGEITFDSGGVERSFVLYRPAAYTRDRRWPLVLALHPNGSNSGYWNRPSGALAIRPLVEDRAVLVLADAGDGDWREDLPGDLEYFDQIITRVERELCIDTQRIFAMGFSGGGSFSGVLGCQRTDIRAIASGGAVIYFEPEACVGNPAAWVTIGDGELIPERARFRDFWRTRNQCATASTPVEPAPCIAYQCPDPNRPVHFCAHPGDHVWPDFGAQAAWQFFAQF